MAWRSCLATEGNPPHPGVSLQTPLMESPLFWAPRRVWEHRDLCFYPIARSRAEDVRPQLGLAVLWAGRSPQLVP